MNGEPAVEPVGTRALAVCCADWPAVALGPPARVPVAVVRANRLLAVTPAARAEGVVPGLRRREAQARCPELEVHEVDPGRDARAFEAVLGVLDDIAPRWELAEAGRCTVASLGPSRYHGGDRALVAKVAGVVRRALVDSLGELGLVAPLGVAVADGPRAAAILAEISAVPAPTHADAGPAGGVVVVARGGTAARLASLPVGLLGAGGPGLGRPADLDELASTLGRLGLGRMGRFAALDPTDVLARFGPLGARAHDVARGRERAPVSPAELPPEVAVSAEVDPPAETVDRVAFAVKALADELHGRLGPRGLACTRVLVVAETEVGDRIERLWRHEGVLSAAAIAQRARWQLDGWLSTGRALGRCRGGVSRVGLVPDEVVADDGFQLGLWGGTGEVGERASQAVARVQALLGHDGVLVPEWRGGRAPGERYRPVPFDTIDASGAPGAPAPRPWPGALPSPAPTVVWPEPRPAEVVDAAGRRVGVGGRGALSAAPARCSLEGGPWLEVRAWAGPWCAEERWWDPLAHRRRARMQVLVGQAPPPGPPSPGPPSPAAASSGSPSSRALLLTLEDGRWWLEASWD